jgi:hypothetical protein
VSDESFDGEAWWRSLVTNNTLEWIGAAVRETVPSRDQDILLSAFLSEVAADDELLAHVASYFPALQLEPGA